MCHVDRSGWWVNNEIPMGVLVHLFFCLEMAMLGCMQSRNMRNSDERDAVWHSNLDFPNFSSKKSTCPLHFCSLPTWFNRPEDAGAGQAPPAPVKKRKSSGTPKEKAAAAGCSWSKSLDVGWVACGRWVHYGWTMPGWSIDVLVHQFHGARLFFENLSFGVSFRNPKMQWNQWEPFENVKMNELTKFPTSFSSGELYSWVCGQWSLLVGSSFGEPNEDDFRIRKGKTRHGGFTLAVSNLFHV